MKTPDDDVTGLLKALRAGDSKAADKLFPLIYADLHRVAAAIMRRERPNHTLQPTALINEAYLRLAGASIDWQNRVHFIAVSAKAMRRIVTDYARAREAEFRGGGLQRVEWDDALGISPERSAEILALDEALNRLEKIKPRQAHIVELHYFGGLTYDEIGAVLSIAAPTAKRDWDIARLWLFKQLKPGSPTIE